MREQAISLQARGLAWRKWGDFLVKQAGPSDIAALLMLKGYRISNQGMDKGVECAKQFPPARGLDI
jgi:hypothetical protein